MVSIKLPSWCEEVYGYQQTAIDEITNQFLSGTKVLFAEAPTGAGKTLIGDLVRQNLEARALYLCSSLSLQDQFMRDFPNAALLRGRSNYPTQKFPERYRPSFPSGSLSCADCTKRKNEDDQWECQFCDPVAACPYESAKYNAIRNSLVCSNTYYFLYEANYSGSMAGRKLIIIDECDTLETILMSFVEVNITHKKLVEFGLPVPSKKTVESAWIEWAVECHEILDTLWAKEKDGIDFSSTLPQIKRNKSLGQLLGDICRLLDPKDGLQSGGWVYTGYSTDKDTNVIFRPIRVNDYCYEYLWKHGDKFLLMSATIISSQEMANSLGLDL